MAQLTPKEQYEQFVKDSQLVFPRCNLSTYSEPAYYYRPGVIQYPECGEGWYKLIIDMLVELISAGWNKQISFIKQKWGYLEVCTTLPFQLLSDKQQEIIRRYHIIANNTCEITGTTEELGWWGDGCITRICREEAEKRCKSSGTNLHDCWTQEHPMKIWYAYRQ